MTHRLAGLYAITPSRVTDPQQLTAMVEQALGAGVRLIQYRDKSQHHAQRRETAEHLLHLTRTHQALLIINDDIELAAAIGADGVHLGQDDIDLRQARTQLGEQAVIGISCYNHFELAQEAAVQGADYIAFGRFFPSRTKPHAAQVDPSLLQRAKRELNVPVAAIGGITLDNAHSLIEAGADMLAVVDGLFGQADVETAAHHFQRLLNPAKPSFTSPHTPR